MQALFLAYQSGRAEATRPLFQALSDALRRYYRMRLGVTQDAEDLTQACLLKVHFARDRFDPARSLKAWVYTIAGRCLIDHWRGAKPAEASLEAVEEASAGGLPHDLRYEYNESLQTALETLKPLDRQIVFLYAVEQLPMAEVGLVVGLSEAAVKVRAHRSYVKLRALLGDKGDPV